MSYKVELTPEEQEEQERYEVKLTPEAQDDFNKLDNSQSLHVKKSFIKLENQGMLAGEALHGNLAGYRKLKHKKLGLRIVFHETVNAVEIIEIIAIGKRSDNEIYTISEKRIRNKTNARVKNATKSN